MAQVPDDLDLKALRTVAFPVSLPASLGRDPIPVVVVVAPAPASSSVTPLIAPATTATLLSSPAHDARGWVVDVVLSPGFGSVCLPRGRAFVALLLVYEGAGGVGDDWFWLDHALSWSDFDPPCLPKPNYQLTTLLCIVVEL